MISSESYAHAFVNNTYLEKSSRVREMLSKCLKLAVTKVQNAVTKRNDGQPLTQECPEVWKLCECLDKALLHGLKQLQYGYWPFVCEFTHPNCKLQLEGLMYVRSSLGRGRSWLCQTLNDSSLESYFTSFSKNPTILGRYYTNDALLRDIQEMHVVMTLMAGLEFVSFNIPVDVALLDSQGFSLMSANNPEPDTLSITLAGSDSKSNSSMTVSVQSSAEDETEMMSIETAVELAADTSIDASFSTSTNTNSTLNNAGSEKQDRVNRLINLVTEHDNVPVDVIHTKVLRRRKKTLTDISYACDNSGSSSSLDSEAAKFCDKSCDQNRNDEHEQCSEDVLRKEISDVKIKVSRTSNEGNSDDGFDWLGERGTPEGQEDPRNSVVVDSPACKSDVMSVEETSIYDSQMSKESHKVVEWNASLDCSDELNEWPYQKSFDSTETRASSVVTQDEIIEELAQDNSCPDGSLRVDTNVALYLALEIFQQEEELLYKAFAASTKRWNCELQPIFLVMTDQSLYILAQGNENQGKFILKVWFSFKDIDKVKVNLNYQSFVIQGARKTGMYEVFTGSDFMTRSILSNLEVSIRRSGVKVLPGVQLWPEPERQLLQKLVSSQLFKSSEAVELQYFACIQWENYLGLSPVSTPAGPSKEGFLMYRRKCKEDMTWCPAYFHLKAGVLYCFKDQDSCTPVFYVQLHYPHFQGCRRLHGTSRPHSFELRLQGREKLLLAAPNDYEASSWQQAIMQMVALFGHLSDVEAGKLVSCNLVVADHHFFIVNEKTGPHNYFIQASAALADLAAVCVDQDSPSSFVLEFESGEANSCGGEWIVLFADQEEKEKAIEVVNTLWQDLFQLPLNVVGFKDLSIWSRCLEHCQKQISLKEQLSSLFATSS